MTFAPLARRWLPVFLAAFVLCLSAGCGRKIEYPLPCDGVSRFPTGEPLAEGDIILARSYGLIGAMFANHSLEGGRFSHGAMVYRGDDGRLMMLNYRPTGMETCTPEEFFTRYYRLALVRYNAGFRGVRAPGYVAERFGGGLAGIAAVDATAKHWLWKDGVRRIPPDYHLDHDEHSAMFCLELTSAVYRDLGLPDPFHFARKANEDPLLRTANEMFKADVYEIRSPSSVLINPHFRLVADWERPEFDLREEALNEELINVLVADILSGLRPKQPRIGGRLKLRKVFFMYHMITKSMFWKPKQDLPDFIDTEVIDNAFMLYTYVSAAKKAAKRRMYEETCAVYSGSAEKEDMLGRVRAIVREEVNARRATYMSPYGRKRVRRPPSEPDRDCVQSLR